MSEYKKTPYGREKVDRNSFVFSIRVNPITLATLHRFYSIKKVPLRGKSSAITRSLELLVELLVDNMKVTERFISLEKATMYLIQQGVIDENTKGKGKNSNLLQLENNSLENPAFISLQDDSFNPNLYSNFAEAKLALVDFFLTNKLPMDTFDKELTKVTNHFNN